MKETENMTLADEAGGPAGSCTVYLTFFVCLERNAVVDILASSQSFNPGRACLAIWSNPTL